MSEFTRFLIVGGFSAGVNVVCRYVIDIVTPYSVAIVLAYLIAMTTAYTLSRLFVFEKSGQSMASEYTRFALVNVVAIFLVWGTSMLFARVIFPGIGWSWHADDIAHMIGVTIPAISSYLGHRHFTFSRKA
ncbi:MAG: GtrA family protein [Pseudomonadota bacterium]